MHSSVAFGRRRAPPLRLFSIPSAILALAVAPREAPAQQRLEVTPFIGSYFALGALGREGPTTERQQNQLAYGGTLFFGLTPTLGVEASVAMTPSSVTITGATNPDLKGNIVVASARARAWMPRGNLFAFAGVGVVTRGGEAWEAAQYTDLTRVAAVLGAGTSAEVNPTWRFDLRAELNLYTIDPDGAGTNYASSLQGDLVVVVGVPLSLSGRAPRAPTVLASVSVSPSELELKVGQSGTLTAEVRNNGKQPPARLVSWRSEDESVARVSDQGVVSAIAIGTTHIVATSSGAAGLVFVRVTGDASVPSPSGAVGAVISGVAVGGAHTCARSQAGKVWCWGDNSTNQIMVGAGTRLAPPAMLEARRATSVVAGAAHTCALEEDGRAVCWGSNAEGQLGSGDRTAREVTIAHRLFTTLATGAEHTCGLIVEGAVLCWGKNDFGQLGDRSTTRRAAPTRATAIGAFVSIAAGARHTCALRRDGRLFCWGDNWSGQVGAGMIQSINEPLEVEGGHRFVQVSAGLTHTCAVTPEGRIHCWGQNDEGQLGLGPNRQRASPQSVSSNETFAAVSSGSAHTCALTKAGRAFCWGRGEEGQLGTGQTQGRLTPTAALTREEFVTIAAGERHTCGVSKTGTVFCWGANARGELGTAGGAASLVPALVEGLR